jgi:hypothetical protein
MASYNATAASSAQPALTALALAMAQRQLDVLHHERRLEWLRASNPMWSCGTSVGSHDQKEMSRSSTAVLSNPILGSNTGPQVGTKEAEELLDWEALRHSTLATSSL